MNSKVSKKDALQAVVLADDFTTSMTPLERVYPSILMPVMNVSLLDYTLEILVRSKVEEVFIYCNNHMNLFKQCMIGKDNDDVAITVIYSDSIKCIGDALRDMYEKGCLRGHFILLRGNSFINTDLGHLINTHRSIVEKDKGAAITMVLRYVGPTKGTSFNEETTLVVSDKSNNKILHYEKLRDAEKKVKMKIGWFLSHDEVRICTALLDTHVYMCSPSVLSLFADNFDFQTMEDFIRGVLMGDEILDSRIYFQELNPEDYAVAVTSWNIYNTLIKDSLHRCTFRQDCFSFSTDITYNALNSIYKHKNATLSKGCLLERECFVDQNVVLGDNNTISTSVLMSRMATGSNVHIRDSYVFPNVKIEDNCTITSSILFSNCVIKVGSKIDGCILCPGVNVAPNSEYTDAFVESAENYTRLSELHGKEGFCYFKKNNAVESDGSSTESSSADSDSANCELVDDTNMFLSEVIDSLLRGYQDKVKCENLILEINSSRYAYNISVREVTYNVVKAILSLPLHYLTEINSPINNKNYQMHLKAMIAYFNEIILNYVKNEDAQDDCLRAIEDMASTTDELLPYTARLLHVFYDNDILSEEKILEWYESEIEDTDVHRKKVRDAVVTVIKWLREAEEDSSE